MTLRSGSPFDDDLAPMFSVGQVADMLGVRAAFVRRLDVEGVVQPARSTGGQRRYSQSDVLQVADVSKMGDEGLTLPSEHRSETYGRSEWSSFKRRRPRPLTAAVA